MLLNTRGVLAQGAWLGDDCAAHPRMRRHELLRQTGGRLGITPDLDALSADRNAAWRGTVPDGQATAIREDKDTHQQSQEHSPNVGALAAFVKSIRAGVRL